MGSGKTYEKASAIRALARNEGNDRASYGGFATLRTIMARNHRTFLSSQDARGIPFGERDACRRCGAHVRLIGVPVCPVCEPELAMRSLLTPP
jgi:hypothetical protein